MKFREDLMVSSVAKSPLSSMEYIASQMGAYAGPDDIREYLNPTKDSDEKQAATLRELDPRLLLPHPGVTKNVLQPESGLQGERSHG